MKLKASRLIQREKLSKLGPVSRECVLTSTNEVHSVSLADNFTVQFSNLLKLLSRIKNKTA